MTRLAVTLALAMTMTVAHWALSEPAQAKAPPRSDTLRMGARLAPGDSHVSPNGRYRLLMQHDGNLVLYRVRRGQPARSRALWSTQSGGNPGASALMQGDGNFVVYSKSRDPLYATGTTALAGESRRSSVVVRDDGSVVVVRRAAHVALWSSSDDRSVLATGQLLRAGQSRQSPNRRYLLTMQTDGNLVLYDAARRPLWSSQTHGNAGAFATMQNDANFVVYTASRAPIYSSASQGDERSRLVVQDDGNVVVYAASNEPRWSSASDVFTLRAGQVLRAGQSRRSPNGQFALVMQVDGNLVLYDGAATALWGSQTPGNPGAWAGMQTDGNLVVYSPSGAPLYATASRADPGSHLLVQDDGNLVIYDGSGQPIWSRPPSAR
jgi:hypothetical protein